MVLEGNRLQALVVTACGAAFMLFGYDQGVLGGIVGTEDFLRTMNYPSEGLLGSIVGLYNIGACIGALLSLLLGDMLGRRRALFVGCCGIFLGTALQASAQGVAHMIVARIVTGVGTGFITVVVPIYQAEVSKAHNRGQLIMFETILLVFGIPLTSWMNFGFITQVPSGPAQWRTPIALQAVFPIITCAALPCLPESPRWLCTKGRQKEMIAVLRRLEGTHRGADAAVETLASQITLAIEEENRIALGWKDIISRKNELQDFRRLVITVLAMFIQQFTGINAIVYYAPVIFVTSIGVTDQMSLILAAVGATIFWFGSIATFFFIEKIGRRPILLAGNISNAFWMLMLFVCQYIGDRNESAKVAAGWAWTAMFFMYYLGFGFSYCNVPWLYSAEICSLRMRNKAHAISTAGVWIFTYIAVQITPTGMANLRSFFWLLWAGFGICFVPIVYFLFPETANRSLEEMDEIFIGHRSWIVRGNQKQKGKGYSEHIQLDTVVEQYGSDTPKGM